MQATAENRPYGARLRDVAPGPASSALAALRREAIRRFEACGLPDRRDEDWRYTSLKPLEAIAFGASDPAGARRVDPAALAAFTLGEAAGPCLVFVDGRFSPALSRGSPPPGPVRATGLADALAADREAVEAHLGRHAPLEASPFVALNTALLEDGAYVRVARGARAPALIHLLFVSTVSRAPSDAHPRSLIVLEEGAGATVVEDHVALEDGVYLANPVAEVVLGERARLEHVTWIRQSDRAFHVGFLGVHLGRASRFTAHNVSAGGRLIRNEVRAVLDGEDVTCTLNGLVVARGEQHIDNQTRILHLRPQGESRERYRAILDARAEGVFGGKIYVAQGAQKTDARQASHALLLSREAEMSTRPELEIYADDVKCTHGATVGQLDADALFYLRSRGLGRTEAANLLTAAFASDVVQRLPAGPIREEVERMLAARLAAARPVRDPGTSWNTENRSQA